MSVLSRLCLFRLNPADGTAKGWSKVIAAYVMFGPLVGAAIFAFYLNIQLVFFTSSPLQDWSKEVWLPLSLLGSYAMVLFYALAFAHLYSVLLAAATAAAVLLLSLFIRHRTTMLVLLVPLPIIGLFYALQRAFDFQLIGAIASLMVGSFITAAPVLVVAVVASFVSWRVATGPAREANQ